MGVGIGGRMVTDGRFAPDAGVAHRLKGLTVERLEASPGEDR